MAPGTDDEDDATSNILHVFTVARRAAVLTANIGMSEPTRSLCGRCRGKGFDCYTSNRSSRQCPRCRGNGFTTVGSTKR